MSAIKHINLVPSEIDAGLAQLNPALAVSTSLNKKLIDIKPIIITKIKPKIAKPTD